MMNYRFAADTLVEIGKKLKQYEGFQEDAGWLFAIAAETRKLAPPINLTEECNKLKPPPPKIGGEGGVKIPVNTPPAPSSPPTHAVADKMKTAMQRNAA
jgi:hypothetical protein